MDFIFKGCLAINMIEENKYLHNISVFGLG